MTESINPARWVMKIADLTKKSALTALTYIIIHKRGHGTSVEENLKTARTYRAICNKFPVLVSRHQGVEAPGSSNKAILPYSSRNSAPVSVLWYITFPAVAFFRTRAFDFMRSKYCIDCVLLVLHWDIIFVLLIGARIETRMSEVD